MAYNAAWDEYGFILCAFGTIFLELIDEGTVEVDEPFDRLQLDSEIFFGELL